MKKSQLLKLGLPDRSELVNAAIAGTHAAAKAGVLRSLDLDATLRAIIAAPSEHLEHPYFSQLARELVEFATVPVRAEPISYQTWGEDIDEGAHAQMRDACSLPMAAGAALMPDAHVGYGLPIGGVLALRDAVVRTR